MKKILTGLFTAIWLLGIIGCSRSISASTLKFSFDNSTPTNSRAEEKLYFDGKKDHVVLNAQLKIDCGSVTLQIANANHDISSPKKCI